MPRGPHLPVRLESGINVCEFCECHIPYDVFEQCGAAPIVPYLPSVGQVWRLRSPHTFEYSHHLITTVYQNGDWRWAHSSQKSSFYRREGLTWVSTFGRDDAILLYSDADWRRVWGPVFTRRRADTYTDAEIAAEISALRRSPPQQVPVQPDEPSTPTTRLGLLTDESDESVTEFGAPDSSS